MDQFNVCVLSGGGAMGAVQTAILEELDADGKLPKFDGYIGSSVGGIAAMALASGEITPKGLNGIFPALCKQVFTKRSWLPIPPIYDTNNFLNAWKPIVKTQKFGDIKNKVIISSVDFCQKKQIFFKNWKDGDKDLAVTEVLLRTFAAPYYFGLRPCPETQQVFGDGGMGYENLPITEAILEALAYKLDLNTQSIKLTVVGTSFTDETETFDSMKKANFVSQIWDFIAPDDGGFAREISRTDQLGQLVFLHNRYPNLHFDYYDIEIPNKMSGMDKIQYLSDYQQYGKTAAHNPLISM